MNEGERRAARHYRLRGYRILARNAWAGGYELDLVLRRGARIVFCEVKGKESARYGDPLEMVDGEKQRRVRRAAEAWLVAHPELAGLEVGFDVVADRGGRLERVAGRSETRPGSRLHSRVVAGPTQDALYARIDLDLSWSERELPERERTKHVHRLHPYLGKFIPQLVEALLGRYFRPEQRVLDPFAGSGTTLVQALESGLDATGVEIAAFNCLLTDVKTRRYNLFVLERELRDALAREGSPGEATEYLRAWYAPRALEELLAFRSLVDDYEHRDVLRVILARAARSARRTPHFDLEFPRAPQLEPYWCHKHRRVCRPVGEASRFLRRYTLDTLARIKSFARVRRSGREAVVVHGDARSVALHGSFDGVLTSPPYPGLIDYHEQHRYAYELLGLDDRSERELGRAADGTTRAALAAYADGVAAALRNACLSLPPGAPVLIVVNDRRDLYPAILERSGLALEDRLRRHVNRRTGRRAGEFFEDVLVARAG